MSNKLLKVPVDQNGNVLNFASPATQHVYIDATEFYGELELVDVEKGRSRVIFTLRDKHTGTLYPMNLRTFKQYLRSKTHAHNCERMTIAGRFKFAKYGDNYTIEPCDSAKRSHV